MDFSLKVDLRSYANRRVLAALSGGADSVALLLLLCEAGAEVCAAHFEHGIRGEESLRDMEFCRDLCARLNVPFYVERGDVPGNRRPGEGLEEAARRLRYAFLARALRESGAEVLVTAHHADDQAETVLMHLFRGAGAAGAAGMRAEGIPCRPLLGVRKRELENYLRARGVSWREDLTNRVAGTPRNALRLQILPAVEAIYPGAVRALGRFARTQALESDFVREESVKWREAHRRALPNGCFYALTPPPPEAILRRVLMEELGAGASFERVEALAGLANADRGRISISKCGIAEKTDSGLFFTDYSLASPPPHPLSLAEETRLGDLAVFAARPAVPVPVRDDPFRQVLLAASLAGAVARTRREGDWIRPLGMRGRKLLSDYLSDRKIARPLRDLIPLVARESEILWAVGVGVSETCAVAAGAEAVELTCRPWSELQYFTGGTKA